MAQGGDALNGFVRDGRYFVGSHGTYTEVSRAAWEWSRVHAISLFLTQPLALASMAYLLIGFIFPSMITPRSAAAGTGRVQQVRESGPAIAAGRTAGRIGMLRLGGPLIEVSVHPAGFVVKPIFMAPRPSCDRRSGSSRPSVARFAAAPSARSPADGRAGWSYGLPPHDAAPPGIIATMEIFGLLVGVALVAAGILWAIPTLGAGGWVWTLVIAGITVVNVVRVVKRR